MVDVDGGTVLSDSELLCDLPSEKDVQLKDFSPSALQPSITPVPFEFAEAALELSGNGEYATGTGIVAGAGMTIGAWIQPYSSTFSRPPPDAAALSSSRAAAAHAAAAAAGRCPAAAELGGRPPAARQRGRAAEEIGRADWSEDRSGVRVRPEECGSDLVRP